jgi:hypothetical protein
MYLDIDGVLLRRRHRGIFDAFEIAPNCLDFLEWATSLFQCRWLSSRCRAGWPDGTRRAFRHAGAPLDIPRWQVLRLIEPALWSVNKTDAIDPASDFGGSMTIRPTMRGTGFGRIAVRIGSFNSAPIKIPLP